MDEAVNTLSEIISNTGLKPKYVKNDKYSCILVMRQYLAPNENVLPDEYFSFELKHVSEAQRKVAVDEYRTKIEGFNAKMAKCEKGMKSWWVSRNSKETYEKEWHIAKCDKDFYMATTPDPAEMDTGLVFSIFVNTMKDYTLTKDKMQVIMTKFILALSSIATDKSMDQQVNTVYQQKQAKATSVQDLGMKISQPEEEGVRRVMKVKPVKKAS